MKCEPQLKTKPTQANPTAKPNKLNTTKQTQTEYN